MDEALGLGTHRAPQAPAELFSNLVARFRQLSEEGRTALPIEISTTNQLAMMTGRTRDLTEEIVAHHLPARRQVELYIQRELTQGQREVELMRQKVAQGKALRSEVEAVEQQYRDLVVVLSQYGQTEQENLTIGKQWHDAVLRDIEAVEANKIATLEGLTGGRGGPHWRAQSSGGGASNLGNRRGYLGPCRRHLAPESRCYPGAWYSL